MGILSPSSLVYSPSFLDALFTLLSYLTNTAIGSQMLSSAGMITTLIHIIDSDRVQPNVSFPMLFLVSTCFSQTYARFYPKLYHCFMSHSTVWITPTPAFSILMALRLPSRLFIHKSTIASTDPNITKTPSALSRAF